MYQKNDKNEVSKIKYSKSSSFYFETKNDFFIDNDILLSNSLKKNLLYASQPRRDKCKICSEDLPNKIDIYKHGIEYSFCELCNHLNGKYDDTKAFIEQIYILNSGLEYSSNYIDTSFEKRSNDIYLPKVDFLLDNLPLNTCKILDIGCGCGYFVYSSLKRGIEASGIDISKAMVEFGNSQISHFLAKFPLSVVDEEGFFGAIKVSNVDVITAIGVIEHFF
ncbi:class I SAM-dependent methyltransferase [Fluviispira vulneris]|uniref:class I SAM-dependent methyltransferase n=1 Tax=Fluviispira vulneris TaxID=2763012 RepID=UPI001C944812|nr:class I SAM-dependent methyltransferase [Fluviispira vulneris]